MPSGFSWSELSVDSARVHVMGAASLPAPGRSYVLYWCMSSVRGEQNHALDAALALGEHLGLPVVVYHALRPDYPHASDRLHAWALEGMEDLQATCRERGITYWVDLPRGPGDTEPRIPLVARRAAAVFSDYFPTFIIPRHLATAAAGLEVPLFAIDSACVVPMQRIAAAQVGAYALRPKLKKLWPEYLGAKLPSRRVVPIPASLDAGFPLADPALERGRLSDYSLDHQVAPVPGRRGGRGAGLAALRAFIEGPLQAYGDGRRDPGVDGQSGLSPYLHWGHLFAGEIADAVRGSGAAPESIEGFLEELLVRRELSFNYCFHTPPERQLQVSSLPAWAQATLSLHEKDARPHLYDFSALDQGRTADPLWNASQRELRESGRIHGYLRMLWGKKILEWTATPQEALDRMAQLNDRYALDGRDPASIANFMWVLGLHDRPFQERPILGKVRPMSSARTADKFELAPYLARWA